MKRLPPLLAILLTTVGTGRAEPPRPMPPPEVAEAATFTELPRVLDLPTALALARVHNPGVRLARERTREQDERTLEVRAGRGPQAALAGSLAATDEGLIEGFGPDMSPATENWSGGVRATQPVFQGGTVLAQERGQRHRADAVREEARAAQYDAMLAAAEAFFQALLARDQIATLEETLRLHAEQLAVATKRHEAGFGPQFDVLQADVAMRNARPPLLRARNQYRLAIEELRRAINLPFPAGATATDVELAGGWPYPDVPYTQAEALEAALAYRPELAALDAQRAAGAQDVRAARGARLPQIAATAGYGWRNKQFGDGLGDTLDGWDAGVEVSIPIFTSGLLRSRERQAMSRILQLELQQDALRQTVSLEVTRAYSDCQVAREILTSADAVIQQADEAVRLARNRFDAGAIPQVDVLQAALGLSRARLDKAEASRDYNLAVARLNRAMGIFSVGERIF